MKNVLRGSAIFVVIVVLLASAVVWSYAPKKDAKMSEAQIGISYAKAMEANKPFIAMFYADWCTYCMKFMPKYKMLSEAYSDKYNFVMINGDDPANTGLMNNFAIGGFPTIYIIDPTIDNRILISNTLYDDIGRVRAEMDRYLRIRAMIK